MIHAVLIAFNNPDQTLRRWNRDLVPALIHTGLPYRVTVIDNSAAHNPTLAAAFKADYLWQEGENRQYGPSINIAVARIPSDFILYACSRHGQAFDPSWVQDLLTPMQTDPTVGMCGFLMGSNSPEGVAHVTGCEWVKEKYRFEDGVHQHVQGGVFMARTETMLKFPYPSEPALAHLYTDHVITWAMEKGGYRVVDVPTICSVWRSTVHQTNGLKYIHDDAHS